VANALERKAQEVAGALGALSLPQRLAAVRRLVPGRLVFTTSFGLEDQAITDAIFAQGLEIDVVTLDTGRLFPETYELWAATEERYGRRLTGYAPVGQALEEMVASVGINGFRQSVEARKQCCGVRKVEPLGRALAGAVGWITGLRSDQSGDRAATPLAETEPARALIKINPIADWTRQDLVAHIADNAIPYNPLHDRGFASIGCAPCTRAIKIGEPERAGRWWWENDVKKECGLHDRARFVTTAAAPREQKHHHP
jgi:phosphoadenosine phosphosulfate reductase